MFTVKDTGTICVEYIQFKKEISTLHLKVCKPTQFLIFSLI